MKKDTGIVSIHGKEYFTVAKRVGMFREKHPSFSLTTEIINRDDECAVMKATIADETGRVLATGHSEEYRHTSTINRTSALENAETSAIGRALAALGLGGTEFASADEVANAIAQQNSGSSRITPVAGSLKALSPEDQDKAKNLAAEIVELWTNGKEFAAYEAYYCGGYDNEFLLGVWDALTPNSEIRNKLKKMHKDPETKKKAA